MSPPLLLLFVLAVLLLLLMLLRLLSRRAVNTLASMLPRCSASSSLGWMGTNRSASSALKLQQHNKVHHDRRTQH